MIRKFNEYIKECIDLYQFESIIETLSQKLFTDIVNICKKNFNNLNFKDYSFNEFRFIKNTLQLKIKNRTLFDIIIQINKKNCNIDIAIFNSNLNFAYEKNYNYDDMNLKSNKYIEQLYYNTIQDFKLYYKQIDKTFIDINYKIEYRLDDINYNDKLNIIVFRKYYQETYDDMIINYIEKNIKNISNLNLDLCSKWVIDKIEHLKNASNFDLI